MRLNWDWEDACLQRDGTPMIGLLRTRGVPITAAMLLALGITSSAAGNWSRLTSGSASEILGTAPAIS